MNVIEYKVENHIAVITLNRPEVLNSFNREMLEKFHEALKKSNEDLDVRCVIVNSSSERAFSAGGDLKAEIEMNSEQMRDFADHGQAMVHDIINHRVPIICAVSGYALGAGFCISLAADLTVAADNAVFGSPVTRLGTSTGWGETVFLARVVGVSRAKEIMYSGRNVKAQEAYDRGLVEFLVTKEELQEKAMELAEAIASKPPYAIEIEKKLANSAAEQPLSEALANEKDGISFCFGTKDHYNATMAFLNKEKGGEYYRE